MYTLDKKEEESKQNQKHRQTTNTATHTLKLKGNDITMSLVK